MSPYMKRDNLAFLAEASKILSSSLEYKNTLNSIANLVVSSLADFCLIDLLQEDGSMTRVAVKVKDSRESRLANKMYKYPPDPKNKDAIYDTAKTGKPILIKKASKKWLNSVSQLEGEHEIIEKLHLNSHIFVPLKSRGRVIGVLTLASQNPKFSYTKPDVLLAEELANRAGVAVDNARLYTEAQEAVRARDEFLSIASHELKTPLTSILLHLQMVLANIKKKSHEKHGHSHEQISSMLESTEKQTKKLAQLINELLNVSVVSTGRLELDKEEVVLATIVKDVIDRFKIQITQGKYKVTLRLDEHIKGWFDKIRIEQIVSNLVSNAIKYGNGKPISISLKKESNQAVLKVKDQGIGIDPKKREKVFERFKRAVSEEDHKDYKGLGLGLYIGKQIAEAHGGTITVESKKDKGSTFILTLPLEH